MSTDQDPNPARWVNTDQVGVCGLPYDLSPTGLGSLIIIPGPSRPDEVGLAGRGHGPRTSARLSWVTMDQRWTTMGSHWAVMGHNLQRGDRCVSVCLSGVEIIRSYNELVR